MLFSILRQYWVQFATLLVTIVGIAALSTTPVSAAGETFSFDNSTKQGITARGGVFAEGKTPNKFTRDSGSGVALPGGYTHIYGNNYDILKPTTYPCKIFLAVNINNGNIKVIPTGGSGSQCNGDAANAAVFGANGIPSSTAITTGTTATEEDMAGVDAVYGLIGEALKPVRDAYYKSLGTSDTPSESEWKQTVYECWTKARSDVAAAGRVGGVSTPVADPDKSTKDFFSICLSGKTGISSSTINDQIKDISVSDINKADGAATSEGDDAGAVGTTCVVDGIGWFVCATANFLGDVVDSIYGAIENMFIVNRINLNINDPANTMYNVWSLFRNIANPVFVILFLFIIFSQLTGAGISNYGIKKTLPRLIVVALLMNLSYWIAAAAVDVSNILGGGIYDLLSGFSEVANVEISANWGNILGALLSGAAITVAGGVVATAGVAAVAAAGTSAVLPLIAIALPLLLGAILAVITAIFALIARQAIIVILIFVAPLAFAAMLLPNTEKLFTKWRQMFVSMLVLYPVMSIIFAGAKLAGLAILATAGGADSDDFIQTGITILTGQAMMVIPLFLLIPLLIKYSGSGIDKLAGNLRSKLNGVAKPISGAARKFGAKGLNRNYQSLKANGAAGITGTGAFARFRRTAAGGVQKAGQAFDQYQSKNKMMEQAYDEKQQDAMLTRLTTDPEYALAAAGGEGNEAKRDQMVARAALAQDERLMKDAKATVGGLSRDQRMQLSLGQSVQVANPDGSMRTISAENAHNRRAALDGIGAMNAAESLEIASSVKKDTDQHVRAAAVGAVANSGAGVPWLSGAQLGNIEKGTFDAAEAIGDSSMKLNAKGLLKGGGHAVKQAKAAAETLKTRADEAVTKSSALRAAGNVMEADKEYKLAETNRAKAQGIETAVREAYAGALGSTDLKAEITQDLSENLRVQFQLTPENTAPQTPPQNTPPTP